MLRGKSDMSVAYLRHIQIRKLKISNADVSFTKPSVGSDFES